MERFFIHTCLFSCLILQKFGFVFGSSYLVLGLPLFAIALAALWAMGRAAVRPAHMEFTLALASMLVVSSCLTYFISDPRSWGSLPSLLLFILLYLALSIGPSRAFNREHVLDIFLAYTFFITIAGICQYFLQFAGLRFVSFGDSFPFLQPFLIEKFFNSNAIVEYGSRTIRSNGVFLLEPSTFSQIIVVAVALEVLVKRRLTRLPFYVVAYLVSFSGTGLLSAGLAMFLNSLFSIKSAMRTGFLALAVIVVVIGLSFVAPEITDRFVARVAEFGSPGTSAYERYVAQQIAWRELSEDTSILTGLGAGTFEKYFVPKGMASNAILKITADYGCLVAIAWLFVFAALFWTVRLRIIGLLVIGLVLLGGGNELNPTFLIPMAIVCIWSGLALRPPQPANETELAEFRQADRDGVEDWPPRSGQLGPLRSSFNRRAAGEYPACPLW